MDAREIENRMIFASSCIECAAKALDTTPALMYQRMKRVDLINGYILRCYEVLHAESREAITADIVECLQSWEERKR
ncbi:MAG: DUF3791 domain-containing protein [Bacteroidales bacterium]|nr:DUF3791 domain-containing protein [Bacteroidales bacterium]